MKAILKLAALLLVLLGSLGSCEEEERKAYLTKDGRFDIDESHFVTMRVEPESGFVDSPVELIIENHTAGVLTLGTAFSLEYFDKDSWTEIQLDINFEEIEIVLEDGEISREPFNLLLIEAYNNGKKGKYRYVKNLKLFYDFPFEIGSDFNLYVAFEVK